MEEHGRKRRAPVRFGNLALNTGISSGEEDYSADNSMEDPNFDASQNKRPRIAGGPSRDESFSFTEENFDDEFDSMQSVNTNNSPTGASSEQPPPSNQPLDECPNDQSDLPLDARFFRKQLMILQENSLEILTRLSVIEESLLKSGQLTTVKEEKKKEKAFAKYHGFVNSNNLPIRTVDDMKKFELSLMDETFEHDMVSLQIIFEVNGRKSEKRCFETIFF